MTEAAEQPEPRDLTRKQRVLIVVGTVVWVVAGGFTLQQVFLSWLPDWWWVSFSCYALSVVIAYPVVRWIEYRLTGKKRYPEWLDAIWHIF